MTILEEDRMEVQFWSAIGFDEDDIIGKLIGKHLLRSEMIAKDAVINARALLMYKYTFGYTLENGELQSVAEFVHKNMVK